MDQQHKSLSVHSLHTLHSLRHRCIHQGFIHQHKVERFLRDERRQLVYIGARQTIHLTGLPAAQLTGNTGGHLKTGVHHQKLFCA